MATAKEVQAALRQLLPTLDINTTTERQVRQQLAEKLGDVEAHKKLIKEEIDSYLTEQMKHAEAPAAEAAGEDDDGDFEDAAAAGAKRKRTSAAAAKPAKEPRSSGGGGDLPGIPLGNNSMKFAVVDTFKGQTRINLRTYFKNRDTGDLAPTKKGISMSLQEWSALQPVISQLSQALDADQDDFAVEMPNRLRATTSVFQGKLQVGIREFYEDAEGLKPGARGINLLPDQFQALVDALPQINQQLPGGWEKAAAAGAAKPAAAAAGAGASRGIAAPAAAGRAAAGAGRATGGAAAGAAAAGAAAAGGGGAIGLGGRKQASISMFTGSACVDLREMYEKDGQLLPTKKGIMLKPDQWSKVCAAKEDITHALHIRNPRYKLDLGNKRQVALSEFKGTWYVGIREYYEKDGKLAPSQKGLNMNSQQWDQLVAGMDTLTAQLS